MVEAADGWSQVAVCRHLEDSPVFVPRLLTSALSIISFRNVSQHPLNIVSSRFRRMLGSRSLKTCTNDCQKPSSSDNFSTLNFLPHSILCIFQFYFRQSLPQYVTDWHSPHFFISFPVFPHSWQTSSLAYDWSMLLAIASTDGECLCQLKSAASLLNIIFKNVLYNQTSVPPLSLSWQIRRLLIKSISFKRWCSSLLIFIVITDFGWSNIFNTGSLIISWSPNNCNAFSLSITFILRKGIPLWTQYSSMMRCTELPAPEEPRHFNTLKVNAFTVGSVWILFYMWATGWNINWSNFLFSK